MDGSTVISALTGGVAGAVLTQAVLWAREAFNRREEGRFAAMQLALTLDSYAADCSDLVQVVDAFLSNPENTAEPKGGLPPLPEYADKLPWRLVGLKVMSEAMGLRVAVSTSLSAIGSHWWESDKFDWLGECADSATTLGLRALDISDRTYAAFKLRRPALPPGLPSFDVRAHLKERHRKRAAERAASAASRVQIIHPEAPPA